MAPRPSAQASQTTARRSVAPLAVIAAVFFLPTYRSCAETGFQSPLEYIWDFWSAVWIIPVFAGAAVFTLLTTRVLIRREVDLPARRLALAALAVLVLSNLLTSVMLIADSPDEWRLSLLPCSVVVAAALVIRHARGRSPWRIWEHLLLGFAVLAAGAFPSTLLALYATYGLENHSVGAYLYLGAIAALLLVTRKATRAEA